MRTEIDQDEALVVDASFIVDLVTRGDSSIHGRIWTQWEESRKTILAPELFRYEVTNAFWKMEKRRDVSAVLAAELLSRTLALQIEFRTFPGIHTRALELARIFDTSTAYDPHYLALAEALGCDYWTSDGKLYRAVERRLPWVNLVVTQ